MKRTESPFRLNKERKFFMTDIDSDVAYMQVLWECITRDELARIDTEWLIHTAHIVHDVTGQIYRIYKSWNNTISSTEHAIQMDTIEDMVAWETQKVAAHIKQTLILIALRRINDDIMTILAERGFFDANTD